MTPDHMLSAHFSLAEMIASQIAIRKQIDNSVAFGSPEYQALQDLCERALEPIRVHYVALDPTAWVHVDSGFRCPALNAAAGGAPASDHQFGFAADIKVFTHSGQIPVVEVSRYVAGSDIEYDEVIHEYGAWTHVSISPKQRHEVLTARHATPIYVPGIQV